MLGFEPRTFCMQSRRSTTELHPQLCDCGDNYMYYYVLCECDHKAFNYDRYQFFYTLYIVTDHKPHMYLNYSGF